MIKSEPDGRRVAEYHGLAFRQNPNAPELFAFVASANELTLFSGVARKSEGFLANYQRALDDNRVNNEVAPFFKLTENCSPTAIVLSLHESPVCEVEFVDSGNPSLDPGIVSKVLRLRFFDVRQISREKLIELAKKFLDERLSAEPGAGSADEPSELIESGEAAEEHEEPLDESATEDDEEEEIEETVEIGQSMLDDLRELLDRPDELAPETIETLREMLMPALVIDGQHRLFGAAAVEEDIPLLVCSLIKPDWKEQVFQFTVINDKAQGIPKPFITSLAGMSLTSTELQQLRDRLVQAKVQLWEVEVMQRLGYDPASAFFQRIDFQVSGGKAKGSSRGLGYQTMKRVGRAWWEPRSIGLRKVMGTLYVDPGERRPALKHLVGKWQSTGDWFRFFCLFWDKVKEKFEPSPLWEMHSQLMTAVAIEQFQAIFLTTLDTMADLTIAKIMEGNPVERRKLVEASFIEIRDLYVGKFSAKSFEKPWGQKSLNHKAGRDLLADYFDKVFKGDTKAAAKHPIFTKPDSASTVP